MKLLHIVPTYLPAHRYGGPIKSVHELNKWLVKKGVDVTVYTTNLDGKNLLNVPLGREVMRDGVKIYYFPVTFRGWQYSYEFHKNLAKNIRAFDLVHITSVFLSASTLGAYYANKFKKPYIISPRGSLMKETLKHHALRKKFYLHFVEKRNLASASATHFTTELEKTEYLSSGLPLKKAIIIPNGLEVEEFNTITRDSIKIREKFGIGNDKKIILFLSRLSWKKGLDTLIPAFAEVIKKEPKAVLVITGGDDEGYKKEIELKIENCKLKISNEVIFTGMLTGQDKIAAYQESDIFVLPSYAENFGQAVVEAMYFGLPVVITKNVGIAPSVERATAGIVIEKTEKQLAEAILKILNAPDLVKKMGEAGRKLVEAEFSWPEIAEKWIKEYNRFI